MQKHRYAVLLLSGAGAVLVTVHVLAEMRARVGAVALGHFFQLAALLAQVYAIDVPSERGRALWKSSCVAQSVAVASLVPQVLTRAQAGVLGATAVANAVVGMSRVAPAPLVATALAVAPGISLVVALIVDRALPVWIHAAAPLVAFSIVAPLPAADKTTGFSHASTVFLPLVVAGVAGAVAAERLDTPLLAAIGPALALCPVLHVAHSRRIDIRYWRSMRLRDAMRASSPAYTLVPTPPGALLREFATAQVDANECVHSTTPLVWNDTGMGTTLPAVVFPGTDLVFVPGDTLAHARVGGAPPGGLY